MSILPRSIDSEEKRVFLTLCPLSLFICLFENGILSVKNNFCNFKLNLNIFKQQNSHYALSNYLFDQKLTLCKVFFSVRKVKVKWKERTHPLPSLLVDAQLHFAIGSLPKLLAQFKPATTTIRIIQTKIDNRWNKIL